MKISKIRAILSTILILSGLLSLSTGAILYFLKYGMWLCFTRNFLNDIHVFSGLIMGISMTVHFVFNRRMYIVEIKKLAAKGK